MDLRKLKTLIDLVSESNVSELEITEAEGKVRIVKAQGAPIIVPNGSSAVHMMAMPQSYAPAPGAVPSPPAEEVATPAPAGLVVKSPMVGTFYRSASPGGTPLAGPGDEVKVGQAICIVEAMKIMNEIESDHAGRVVKVLAENGQAVEFGQPLFVIE